MTRCHAIRLIYVADRRAALERKGTLKGHGDFIQKSMTVSAGSAYL